MTLLAGHSADATRDVVRDTTRRLRDTWQVMRADALLPELIEHIDHRLARHPLMRDR